MSENLDCNWKQEKLLFEEVLGRRINTCFDCKHMNFDKPSKKYKDLFHCDMLEGLRVSVNDDKCILFTISDKTKAMIKIIMRDCEKVGIDICPRYTLSTTVIYDWKLDIFKYYDWELILSELIY